MMCRASALRTCFAAAAAAIVATLLRSPAAHAQSYPSRAISIIVPFPPGPAVDLVARLVGAKLAEALGQSVVIENRTGANGTIGSNAVARAAPDGHMLLMATAGTHVTAPHLMKALPYDPVKDFTPIAAAVEPVTCLVINGKLPISSVEELIAHAKAQPNPLSYGSSGNGSVFHLMGELFVRTAGVRLAHVAYRGVEPAMQDVIGGHIPMTFIAVSNAIEPHLAGSAKILAILEPQRYQRLPEIRSMSEIIPAFAKPSSWFGFLGPAGMAPEVVGRLNGEIVKALNAPDVKARLDRIGLAVIGGSAADFAALLKDGIERYGAIIRDAGIKGE